MEAKIKSGTFLAESCGRATFFDAAPNHDSLPFRGNIGQKLSISLSFYLSIYLYIYLSIYISLLLFLHILTFL